MVVNTENDPAPNISGAKAEKTCVTRNRPADKKENKKTNKKPKRNQTFNSRKVTLLFLLTPSKEKPGQTETGPEVRPRECEPTLPCQVLRPLALVVPAPPVHALATAPPSLPLQLPLSPPLHSHSWAPTFISKSQFSAMALAVWGSSASTTRV